MLMIGAHLLEGEQQQEGHHQTEQTHGLRQGESQDSVREQLLLQRGVAGITDDQGSEHCSDTGTCVGERWMECGKERLIICTLNE